MGFDIFTAIMAVLSIFSFGAIGGADLADELPEIEIISGTADSTQNLIPAPEPEIIEPDFNPAGILEPQAEKPGASLIAGTWAGTKSIPFTASLSCRAVAYADGTALFSGVITSTMFGDHNFRLPASWEYLGGDNFNTVIQDTETGITCDGTTLTFPANPYRLGLVDNKIADQNFIIELKRV